ncbi:MAG: hypothetical protein NZ750_01960 [Anaerolineae bacterium]|nr:hypothetical protein [Anaerolineae bacterium]MDW8173556.1 hypothetical protein [Anaerolineae bacterium]
MSTDKGAHLEQVQQKIRNLVTEFTQGKVSAEQFNILYERFSAQLALASSGVQIAQDESFNTVAIRSATRGKAVGLGVYHHRSGTMVETLGSFDVPPAVMSGVLNEFSDRLERHELIEPRLLKLESVYWLVFMARTMTTAIIVFVNEPSAAQLRELERIHHDFEEANRHHLEASTVDPHALARPFLGFIKRRLGG